MDTKACFVCTKELPLISFYKHSGMKDGHLGKCKECAKKDAINNRNENIDYYREFDRNRSNLPHRVAVREAYANTDEGIESARKSKANWTKNNRKKKWASGKVAYAVRSGKLKKPTKCEECGRDDIRLHGHHDDYSKPLNVRWLCSKDHRAWHKKHGEVKVVK